MSLLDDAGLKPDFQEWLMGPINLLHTIFVEVIPGMVFAGLLWAGGDVHIQMILSSTNFGYKTRIALLLTVCYILGKLLPLPAFAIASALKFLAFFANRIANKKQPVVQYPPSSGFDKWLSGQNDDVKRAVNALAATPLYLGKKRFLQSLIVSHAETGFYLAMGNAFLIAAVLRPSPLRKWEIALAILSLVTSFHKYKESQDSFLSTLVPATADMLTNMSADDRIVLLNALRRFAALFRAAPPVQPSPSASPPKPPGDTKAQGAAS